MSKWRDHSKAVIARVLLDTKGKDKQTIRQALYDAYPFGQRAMHPYKIWLDEIKRQRRVHDPVALQRAVEGSGLFKKEDEL